MKKILIILALILVNGNIFINEVMYDPDGDDNNREFIEISHDVDVNLSNYTINDLDSEDSLKQVKYFSGNYSLIVEEEFNYSSINATIYDIGKTIGNSLNNDKDAIIIKNGTKIVDVFSYNEKSDGKSLCM